MYKYRIVKQLNEHIIPRFDDPLVFEFIPQFRPWWCPLWFTCFKYSKSSTREGAKKLIKRHKEVCKLVLIISGKDLEDGSETTI